MSIRRIFCIALALVLLAAGRAVRADEEKTPSEQIPPILPMESNPLLQELSDEDEFYKRDINHDNVLSGAEMRGVEDFDANHDGDVTLEEFKAGMALRREQADDENTFVWRGGQNGRLTGFALRGIESYDIDGKKSITKEQYLAFRKAVRLRARTNPALTDEARVLFWRLDINGDGRLSGTEMKEYARFDPDKTGRIYEDDFVAAFVKERADAAVAAGPAEALQGEWTFENIDDASHALARSEYRNRRLVIRGDKIMVTVDGRTAETWRFTLDAKKTLREMDILMPQKRQPILAIYDLADGVLRICMHQSETQPRPTEFATPEGTDLTITTLHRTAPGDKIAAAPADTMPDAPADPPDPSKPPGADKPADAGKPAAEAIPSNKFVRAGSELTEAANVEVRQYNGDFVKLLTKDNVAAFPGNRVRIAEPAGKLAAAYGSVAEKYRAAAEQLEQGAKAATSPVMVGYCETNAKAYRKFGERCDALRRLVALFEDPTIETADEFAKRRQAVIEETVTLRKEYEALRAEVEKIEAEHRDDFRVPADSSASK